MKTKIYPKITLSTNEIHDLIREVYIDGFNYGQDYDEHWKKYNNCKGRSVESYSEIVLKKIINMVG